ncbi:MAG TPA: hypothetical protein VF834_24790 [Streptosporangiaceae bacterium]
MPARGRSEHASHLTGSWQVTPVPGAQGEVLVLTGLEPGQALPDRRTWNLLGPAVRGWRRRLLSRACGGEPVIRVRPAGDLLRIHARRLDASGEGRQLMAASLADDSERLPVPDQPQRDVVGASGLVVTRDRGDFQQGSVYAT